MKRWEYIERDESGSYSSRYILDSLGEDGWELVGWAYDHNHMKNFVFKREVSS